MKLRNLLVTASVLSTAALAHATTTGLQTAPLGSRTGDVGYAIFESEFIDSLAGSAYGFTNIVPNFSGGPGFITSTLSASMTGGSGAGSGDRIYNGTGATSAAFNITLNANVFSDINNAVLQIKYSRGDTGEEALPTLEHYRTFFTITLNGISSNPVITSTPDLSGGLELVGGSYMGVVQWSWENLNLKSSDTMTFAITSPAIGHVSVDAISLDAAPVPEPGTYAIAAALLALVGFRVYKSRRDRVEARA